MSDFEFYEIELNKYLGSINEIIESSYAPGIHLLPYILMSTRKQGKYGERNKLH